MNAARAVEVVGVSKVFNPGTTRQVDALVDVDLVVAPGEFVSLIGPSGCGKSTLLRLIANLIEPTSGDDHGQRQAGRPGPARPGVRDGLPAGRPVRLAQRGQERRAPARAQGLGQGAPPDPGDGDAAARQARRLRRAPAVAAVGWHAAAGRHRPGPGRPPGAAADGRAVRRARRDDPRAHAGRAAAHLRRDRHERRLRHPLDPRGRVPVRPGGRDVAAARTDHPRHRRRPRRPPRRRHARGRRLLQEDHRGPRGACAATRSTMSWPASRIADGDLTAVARVPDRVAAGRVRRRLPRAVGAGRRGLRLEAVLPAQAVEHLGGVRRQLRARS